MTPAPLPFFTEEHGLFYLWKPEPQANRIQLSGKFRSEEEMQKRSIVVFGVPAERRAAK